MNILFATRSPGKQPEVRRILEHAGFHVVFPDDAGVYQSADEEALETSDSFETNARQKAEYFARKTGLPTVADDSGLEILSLGGAPGARSRRWAGATGTSVEIDTANNAELLRRLRGAPEIKRRGRYRCVLVYVAAPGKMPRTFDGECAGRILDAPRGAGGFGYDPLFLSDELGKTFAEATAEEKDQVSHRGRALQSLIAGLKSK